MFTVMKAYVAVTVLLSVGFSLVRGQSALEECVNQLKGSLARLGPDFCDDFDEYVKCLARAQGVQILGIDRGRLRQIQRSIENSFSSLPVQCDFDIFDLVRKVRVEDIQDAAAHNASDVYAQGVTEFDDATNIGECANAYVYHVTNTGAITCDDTTDYVECVLEALAAPTFDITDDLLEEYEQDFDETLELLNIEDDCDVDLDDILEDLRIVYTMTLPVTTTTTMAPIVSTTTPATTTTTTTTTTASTATTEQTTAVTTKDPDFETATNEAQCTSAIYRIIMYRRLTCDDANGFVTCIARVLNLAEANLSDKMIKSLEKRLKRQWSLFGLRCPVDLEEILEKLSGGTSQPDTTTPKPVTTTDPNNYKCVWDETDGCANILNGDYKACSSQCQRGVYVTCSNGIRYVRDCPLGWYRSPRGNPVTAKLVFDPVTGACQYSTPLCPRYLDDYVLDGNRK